MKRLLAPGVALLAGVAIGAFAVHGLHAQATPPAYVITEIDVADNKMDTFLKDYAPLIQPTFQPFGGHYIIRGGNTVTLDGIPPKRIVVTMFDSMEKVKAWRASEAYKTLIPMMDQVLTSIRAYAVEGTTQ